jgi:hypothetical protein
VHAAPALPAPPPAPAPLAPDALGELPGPDRLALRDALQQLDMRRVDALMARLRPAHPDAAAAIDAMLAAHRYPALCALLEHSLAGQEQ